MPGARTEVRRWRANMTCHSLWSQLRITRWTAERAITTEGTSPSTVKMCGVCVLPPISNSHHRINPAPPNMKFYKIDYTRQQHLPQQLLLRRYCSRTWDELIGIVSHPHQSLQCTAKCQYGKQTIDSEECYWKNSKCQGEGYAYCPVLNLPSGIKSSHNVHISFIYTIISLFPPGNS